MPSLTPSCLSGLQMYYMCQWLPNRDQAVLWNHFDRDGPHTTNHSERYHAGLRSLFDTRRRLPLGKMQELHNEIRQRVKQLERGATPTVRRPQYVQNNINIQIAKDSLQQWIDMVAEPDEDALRARLLRHLDRVQHLLR